MRARSQTARRQLVGGAGTGVEMAAVGGERCSVVVERSEPVSRSVAAALGRVNRHIAYKDLVSLADAMGSTERGSVMPMIQDECQLAAWSFTLGCSEVARAALSRMVTLIEFMHSAGDGRTRAGRGSRAARRGNPKR